MTIKWKIKYEKNVTQNNRGKLKKKNEVKNSHSQSIFENLKIIEIPESEKIVWNSLKW